MAHHFVMNVSVFSLKKKLNFDKVSMLNVVHLDKSTGVRTALLDSEDNECPECSEKGSSPGSLIPNRFLRNSVNSFKNETGYNKPRQPKSKLQ